MALDSLCLIEGGCMSHSAPCSFCEGKWHPICCQTPASAQACLPGWDTLLSASGLCCCWCFPRGPWPPVSTHPQGDHLPAPPCLSPAPPALCDASYFGTSSIYPKPRIQAQQSVSCRLGRLCLPSCEQTWSGTPPPSHFQVGFLGPRVHTGFRPYLDERNGQGRSAGTGPFLTGSPSCQEP